MFHLLVSYQGWEPSQDDVALERVLEYTRPELRDHFRPAGILDPSRLLHIPALFMTEVGGKGSQMARLGNLISVQQEGTRVVLNYAFRGAPIPNQRIRDLAEQLDIHDFEFYRTHWAIKDPDLFQVLLEHAPETTTLGYTGAPIGQGAPDPDKSKVFIIHGRDTHAVTQMEAFVVGCGLVPVKFDTLRGQMGGTPTIAEIVTAGMDQAQGIIALFTPDEFASLRDELRGTFDAGSTLERWQARPNVMFEAGMAFGRDRRRVVFTLLRRPELFTDVAGIHVIHMDGGNLATRKQLRETLRSMGCAVAESAAWESAGDFRTVHQPVQAPLRRPVPSDDDANIRLKGWLGQLGEHRSGHVLELDEIAQEAKVTLAQVRHLLPEVVGRHTLWDLTDMGNEVAILRFNLPF